MRRAYLGLPLLVLLSACADPLRDLPRLSDVEISEKDPVASALPTEQEIAREGILQDTLEPETPLADPQNAPAQPRRGLMGLFDRLTPNRAAQSPDIELTDAPATLASLSDTADQEVEDQVDSQPLARPAGGGLLARALRRSPPAANGAADGSSEDVALGTALPYGTVGRVCDARGKSLGKAIDRATAGGHKLYDSAPGRTGLRTFYITGFADGCPRQLTAAHVLLGAPSFYELLHYGPAGAHLPVGATDKAYEKVKRDVCGVRKGKPCGSKIRSLERSTFFVNTYERDDDNTRWSELLVHRGQVVATAMKTN